MAKVFSTKHTIQKFIAFGSNVGGGGQYAIMATVRGSYGETTHRIVGNSYKDLEKCIARAFKYYNERRYQNIELMHLQSQRRITIYELATKYQHIINGKTIH